MIVKKHKGYRGDGSGMSWPSGPSGSVTVKDVFGPRPFNAHIATVGYDYDLHRGVDLNVGAGDVLYSPLSGSVIRAHQTHFGFEDSDQLNHFTFNGLSGAISSNNLALTCTRDGVGSFPANIDICSATRERIAPYTDDWVIEIELAGTISINGALGIGLFTYDLAEYVGLEYNGSTFTMRGKGAGGLMTADGTTSAQASKTWYRVAFTKSTDTIAWRYSTDGVSWSNTATETGVTWTGPNVPAMIPAVYWLSGDTGTAYTINVSTFNWTDEAHNVGRFGNWCELGRAGQKTTLIHFRTLEVAKGQHVSVGQRLGKAGQTGFDLRSGRVQSEHCHVEIANNNTYEYANADAVNPLHAGFLPRANVSNNVTVALSTANDPDNVASWLVNVSVARADQDFDFNNVVCTGNVATRTVDLNLRTGINADNDIPKTAGIYIVPSSFNENSAYYNVGIYFNKSVVGTGTPTITVKDTAGITLATA